MFSFILSITLLAGSAAPSYALKQESAAQSSGVEELEDKLRQVAGTLGFSLPEPATAPSAGRRVEGRTVLPSLAAAGVEEEDTVRAGRVWPLLEAIRKSGIKVRSISLFGEGVFDPSTMVYEDYRLWVDNTQKLNSDSPVRLSVIPADPSPRTNAIWIHVQPVSASPATTDRDGVERILAITKRPLFIEHDFFIDRADQLNTASFTSFSVRLQSNPSPEGFAFTVSLPEGISVSAPTRIASRSTTAELILSAAQKGEASRLSLSGDVEFFAVTEHDGTNGYQLSPATERNSIDAWLKQVRGDPENIQLTIKDSVAAVKSIATEAPTPIVASGAERVPDWSAAGVEEDVDRREFLRQAGTAVLATAAAGILSGEVSAADALESRPLNDVGVQLAGQKLALNRLPDSVSKGRDSALVYIENDNHPTGKEPGVFYVQPKEVTGKWQFRVVAGSAVLTTERNDHRTFREGHLWVVLLKDDAAVEVFRKRVKQLPGHQGEEGDTHLVETANRHDVIQLLKDEAFVAKTGLTVIAITSEKKVVQLVPKSGLEEKVISPDERFSAQKLDNVTLAIAGAQNWRLGTQGRPILRFSFAQDGAPQLAVEVMDRAEVAEGTEFTEGDERRRFLLVWDLDRGLMLPGVHDPQRFFGALAAPVPAQSGMEETVAIRADIASGFSDLFGDKTVNGRPVSVQGLISRLSEELEPDFQSALAARSRYRREVAAGGAQYGFSHPDQAIVDVDGNMKTVAQIRKGMRDNFFGDQTAEAWRLNPGVPTPAEVVKPGLQGTGPGAKLGMLMGAINAGQYGAVSWMIDQEDAGPMVGNQPYEQVRNLARLTSGQLDGVTHTEPSTGKNYRLQAIRDADPEKNQWPVLFYRVPGLHLRSRTVTLDGRSVPEIIPMLVLYTLNNYDAQTANGSGIYFYIPKIETPEEALLIARLLKSVEDELGLGRGTIKIEMLHERARYTANQESIMWVLRHWLAGPNVGRWDYINSRIEQVKDDPAGVFPDPHKVTMTDPTMTEYTRRNAILTLLVNGFPIGGMSAVMENPAAAPEVNQKAVRSIWFDKLRERLTGLIVMPNGQEYDAYRQSWVATTAQGYVEAGAGPLQAERSALQELVDQATPDEKAKLEKLGLINSEGQVTPFQVTPDYLDNLYSADAWARLFNRPAGTVTEEGLRYAITMASEYMFQVLNGNSAAAIEDPLTGTRLMNDFATYEIFWHWLWTALRHQVPLSNSDGTPTMQGNLDETISAVRVTPELVRTLLRERSETVARYFEQHPENPRRFDRRLAPVVMAILERHLLYPEWITYGSRVLYSILERDEPFRNAILEGIFGSRDPLLRQVGAARFRGGAVRDLAEQALTAHDFVRDIFPDPQADEQAIAQGFDEAKRTAAAGVVVRGVQGVLAVIPESKLLHRVLIYPGSDGASQRSVLNNQWPLDKAIPGAFQAMGANPSVGPVLVKVLENGDVELLKIVSAEDQWKAEARVEFGSFPSVLTAAGTRVYADGMALFRLNQLSGDPLIAVIGGSYRIGEPGSPESVKFTPVSSAIRSIAQNPANYRVVETAAGRLAVVRGAELVGSPNEHLWRKALEFPSDVSAENVPESISSAVTTAQRTPVRELVVSAGGKQVTVSLEPQAESGVDAATFAGEQTVSALRQAGLNPTGAGRSWELKIHFDPATSRATLTPTQATQAAMRERPFIQIKIGDSDETVEGLPSWLWLQDGLLRPDYISADQVLSLSADRKQAIAQWVEATDKINGKTVILLNPEHVPSAQIAPWLESIPAGENEEEGKPVVMRLSNDVITAARNPKALVELIRLALDRGGFLDGDALEMTYDPASHTLSIQV
ncbi:MAG: hypothetical protein HYZ88_03540 [Candidatus Omnitrophica bacterium]|nr:hypothetical protein [Candidatus Omnitrophota bacterium]